MEEMEEKPVEKELTMSSVLNEVLKLEEKETTAEQKEKPIDEVVESVASFSKSKLKRMKKKEKQKEEEAKRQINQADTSTFLFSECASHSSRIRQILARYGIYLPDSVNLNEMSRFVEQRIHGEGEPIDLVAWLDWFKQTVPPTHFSLIRGNISFILMDLDHYIQTRAIERSDPTYEETTMEQKGEPIDEVAKLIEVDPFTFVLSERAAHSSRLRQILDRYGISLTDSVNLDEMSRFIENEIQCTRNELLYLSSDQFGEGEPIDGVTLLDLFHKAVPPTHFSLIRQKLRFIKLAVEKYIVSRARERSEIHKSSNPLVYGSGSSEKKKEEVTEVVESAASVSKSKLKRMKEKEKMNNKLEEGTKSATSDSSPKSNQNTKIPKPDHIPGAIWQRFYEFGNYVADYVLNGFAVKPSAHLDQWDMIREENLVRVEEKKERILVCEYIIVERMKKEELFCCNICQMYFFNYKQALGHFMSEEHFTMGAVVSRVSGMARAANFFKELPISWTYKDIDAEKALWKQFGPIMERGQCTPTHDFVINWMKKYALTDIDHDCRTVIQAIKLMMPKMKTEIGQKAMAELHNHLGHGTTFCIWCNLKTGGRDGFYKHNLSELHMMRMINMKKSMGSFSVCPVTMIVNLYKKDLL